MRSVEAAVSTGRKVEIVNYNASAVCLLKVFACLCYFVCHSTFDRVCWGETLKFSTEHCEDSYSFMHNAMVICTRTKITQTRAASSIQNTSDTSE